MTTTTAITATSRCISARPAPVEGQAHHVAVPLHGDHVLRRAAGQLCRAPLRRPDLAKAASCASLRADRRVQYVRPHLFERDDRPGPRGRPGQQDPGLAKAWMLATLLLGSLFLGVKGYEYSSKFSHGIYPWKPRGQIYERPDLYYGSAVRRRLGEPAIIDKLQGTRRHARRGTPPPSRSPPGGSSNRSARWWPARSAGLRSGRRRRPDLRPLPAEGR